MCIIKTQDYRLSDTMNALHNSTRIKPCYINAVKRCVQMQISFLFKELSHNSNDKQVLPKPIWEETLGYSLTSRTELCC